MTTIFYGSVANPVSLTQYDALPRCLVSVAADGTIDWIVEDVESSMVQQVMAQKGCIDPTEIYPLSDGEFLMPGLVDTHIVRFLPDARAFSPMDFCLACSPENLTLKDLSSGQQYELLDWLEKITFPMESRFSDVQLATEAYKAVVRRIIDSGTTTCCYYGTLHLEATKKLADTISGYGQRAFVGKCNMDRNCPPDYVEPSHESSIETTKTLISYIKSLQSKSIPGEPLVQPILTPRFAISCSSPLLKSLGELASSEPAIRIQTHLAENPSEIEFTKELFPECRSYSGVYDSFGLLRSNTVLAHAVYLEKEDLELIVKRKAGISHCPTSNFNLSSGVAPIGEYLDLGIKVGLGTDVSGGFSVSILQAMRDASIAAKVVAMQSKSSAKTSLPNTFSNKQLSIPTLLYLATLGGAEVCNLERQTGSFAPGKSFDALLVDVRTQTGNPGIWGVDAVAGPKSLEGLLERFIFCGDDRNISRVFVQGKLIGGVNHRG
ncbi:hypothetical protein C8J56DRAFT_1055974 [Mycena floridula]|nr:hypothetical protein C8J56DRAFT_1055974 [Mycena floridula]